MNMRHFKDFSKTFLKDFSRPGNSLFLLFYDFSSFSVTLRPLKGATVLGFMDETLSMWCRNQHHRASLKLR